MKHWLHLGLWLTAVTLGVACGGINTSHSVSPASFFLPGLIRVEPAPAPGPAAPADGPVAVPVARLR